jgi:hypothetical protein
MFLIFTFAIQSCSDESHFAPVTKDFSNSGQLADIGSQTNSRLINPDSVRSYLKQNYFWGDYYNSPNEAIKFGLTFSDSVVYLTDYYGTTEGSWRIEQNTSSTIVRISFFFTSEPRLRTLSLDIKQTPAGTLYFDFYLSQTGFYYFKGPFQKATPEESIQNTGWSANQSAAYTNYEYFFGNEADSMFTLRLPQDTLTGKYHYDIHSQNMVRVRLDNGGSIFFARSLPDHGISTEDLFNTGTVTSKGIKRKYTETPL